MVEIFFKEKGRGEHTFVLIHGTGGDNRQLGPQFEMLSEIGRTIALDLRGHGKSDKPDGDYSLESFAHNIYQLCTHLKIHHPILVGFSMGGNIALELAAEYPRFAKALILLDSALLYTEKVREMVQQCVNGLKTNPYVCIQQIVDNGSLPTDRLKKQMYEGLIKTSPHVWSSCFESMLKWDQKAPHQCKKCTLPILYIEAAHPLVDMQRFKELCPQLIHGKIVGAGHFLPLEVPDQVNPMIKRYLSVYLNN